MGYITLSAVLKTSARGFLGAKIPTSIKISGLLLAPCAVGLLIEEAEEIIFPAF